MRTKLIATILFGVFATGCIVHTRGGAGRRCAPGHHWNGNGCVHNGRGNGPPPDKVIIRDHRR